MKITKVEPLLIDRFCLVRIETDVGITGIGEAGAWGQLEASATAITKYAEYLLGKDPRPIEHHWNVMLRANHFTGSAITGAVSAIDIALWDIKGKFHNVPVYELLGGKMRHKARIYGHVKGRTIDSLLGEARRLKQEGFGKITPSCKAGVAKHSASRFDKSSLEKRSATSNGWTQIYRTELIGGD